MVRNYADKITPLVSGRTDTESEHFDMPETIPDRFEPGTLNLPAIVSMLSGLRWILSTGKLTI